MHITKYLAGMRWEFFAVAWIFFIFGCRYQNQTNDAIDQWHTEVHYVRYMHIGYRLPSIYHPFLMLYCWCYANQNLIVNIAGDFFFSVFEFSQTFSRIRWFTIAIVKLPHWRYSLLAFSYCCLVGIINFVERGERTTVGELVQWLCFSTSSIKPYKHLLRHWWLVYSWLVLIVHINWWLTEFAISQENDQWGMPDGDSITG